MRFRTILIALLATQVALSSFAAPKKGNKEANESLVSAASEGHADDIIAALKAGADPLALDSDGTNAFVLAMENNLETKEAAVVKAFLKAKAPIDASAEDGMTPLMGAAAFGHEENVKALLAAGAKINAKDKDQWTPLMWAAAGGEWSVIDALVAAKANIEATEKDGWTAMMLAINTGRGSVVEKLVAAGAKIPTGNPSGTPVMVLAANGRDLQVVQILAEHGAALDAVDEDGWTGLELAANNGDAQIVMEFLRAGADPTIKDHDSKVALDRAMDSKDVETIALLGGKWEKPAIKRGSRVTIQCPGAVGAVEGNFAVEDDALVITTSYPKPLSYYLGAGSPAAKKFTFQSGMAPSYYIDTDSNAKTGTFSADAGKAATGAEYAVEYSQFGTTVVLHYQTSEGQDRQKHVFANVMSVDIKKGEEAVDTSNLDESPDAENASGVLRTKIPLSLLSLTPGKTIRVTGTINGCTAGSAQVKLK